MNARAALRSSILASVSASMAAALVVEQRVRTVDDARRDRYVRTWAKIALRTLGVEVAHVGEIPAAQGPRLVVANHRSTLDILLMLATFGGHLLAKGEMEHWPIAGTLAKMAGTLFVDRADAQSGATAIRAMKEKLEKGRLVGVFPEGTTFVGDEVRPFHAGAFMAIARVRGEVLPVGLAYASEDSHYREEPIDEHYARVAGARKTHVALSVGAPLAARGAIAALAEKSRGAVQDQVHRARAWLGR
ncbi:MAG: 1-acyl-sn-glycerol-3-phosphate acyltransferase [Myxococcales bacterium]|nr:1-acyl-sn-glycerol-3-phosphate acyltransferase [Myxococcales bacterium]